MNVNGITGEFCALWEMAGFKKYKMRKFEEYSLYLKNKNFLQSEYVITFNDLSGKLLALKPDVTLSILKNTSSEDGGNQKLYYTESVYRLDKRSHTYNEIDQAGLEVIGKIGTAEMAEVILLALKTLKMTSTDYTLDISHMGILEDILLEVAGDDVTLREEILSCLAAKNAHDLSRALAASGIGNAEKLEALIALPRDFEKALARLASVLGENEYLEELTSVFEILKSLGYSDRVSIDFSIINDLEYYNGIVFKGYLMGAPRHVLSGGRYDKLADKFKKGCEALGFAVYLGELPPSDGKKEYDCDVLIVSDNPLSAINTAEALRSTGKSVRIERAPANDVRAREILEVV